MEARRHASAAPLISSRADAAGDPDHDEGIRESQGNFCPSLRLAGSEGESPNMKSIHRSILTRALMTGVASLAFVMISAGGVRAEIVTVQGDDALRARTESIQATPACWAATASRFPPTQAVRSRSQRR